ncbi:hypothetical protein LSH36_514g01090 [Paralvinella palmiformis]|uniref:KIND domain-containing protein n=1 Tax=Paralvinella palmiformis TaxID=53620 RepID=A0AAD9J7L5_9ANNE|nr:hypothetical protein LSH36_514g01090 [Paralvinella palmiformis]
MSFLSIQPVAMSDPESLYVPPEYDSLGNSSKGHMFSLGMTILYAAVYSSVAQPQTGLDPGVNKMIVAMTDDDYDNRPDVDEVLAVCEENLANCSVTSLKVCHWLISDAKDVFLKIYSIDSPDAELRSRSVTPDSKIVKSRNSGSTGTKSASPFSVSDNSSPVCDIISPPDLYCDSDNQEDLFTSEVPASQYREGSEICAECPRTSDCVGLRELQLSDGLKETTGVSEVRSDVTERLEGPVVDDKGHEQDAILDDNYLGQNSTSPLTNGYLTGCDNGEGSPSRDNHRGSDVMHDDDVVITGCGSNNESIDATGARSEIRHRSADGAEDNASVGDFNGYACREGFGRNRLLASQAERESSVTTECELSDGCVEEEPSSILGAGDGVVVVEDALNELSQGDDTVRLQQTSNSPCSNAADSLPRIFMGNESSSEEATADGSGSDGKTVSKLSPGSDQCVPDRRRMGKSPDSSALDAAGCTCTGNTFASDESSQDEQGSQLVIDVVKNLGALNESELWSLCRECMLALLKCKQQLPVYISLDTVAIEADGHVTFHSMPDDKELDALYLAPELQEVGIITDKTCMFSVSAMLWSAADYSLPASEEPALSEELESLLESMIKEDEDRRPEIVTVLESCNDYQDIHGISSEQTCAALIAESKAAAYSKENTFILDVISQELQKNTLLHHAKVMECIKQAKVKLKPASERQLADRPAQDTFHDLLMNEIRNRYPLRKVGKPKEFTARDLYGHNQELLSTLVHVTRQKSFDNSDSAFTVISKSLSKPDQEMGAEPKSDVAVPHEYNSTATHFTPIEISNRKNIRPQLKLKSHFLGQKQGPSQKTSEIVKNIQEMKRNILRIQESRTLVQDLESDVQREENGSVGCDLASEPSAKRPQSQRSSGTNTSTTPSVSGNSQEGSSRKQSPNVSQPCTVPLTLGPAVLPVQYQLQQDPMTGLVNLVPVAFTQNVAGVNSPFLANQTRPLFPMMGMSMPVAGTMMPGQFLRYGTADGVGMRSEEEQDSKPRPQATSRRSSVCESPKSQVLGYNPIPEADISERLVVRSESANNIIMDSKQQGENYVDLYPPSEIQKGDYPFSNNHPIRPRQVKAKDQMSKLKRAKSGSCIDYYKMANSDCSQNVAERRHGDNEPKNGQPTYMNVHDKVTRRKRYSGGLSPDIPSSPSPSLSKDSRHLWDKHERFR